MVLDVSCCGVVLESHKPDKCSRSSRVDAPRDQVDFISGDTTSFVGRFGGTLPTFNKFGVIGSGERREVDRRHTQLSLRLLHTNLGVL